MIVNAKWSEHRDSQSRLSGFKPHHDHQLDASVAGRTTALSKRVTTGSSPVVISNPWPCGEIVDASVSEADAYGRAGASPARATNYVAEPEVDRASAVNRLL